MKEPNQPTRDFAEIFRMISDPLKKEEYLFKKRRESILEEKKNDYCLGEKNENQRDDF